MSENNNKPRAREKNVTSGGKGVHIRNEGSSSSSGQQITPAGTGGSSNVKRAAVGGGAGAGILALIIAFVQMFTGGGGDSGAGNDPNGYKAENVTEVNRTVAEGSREKRTVIKGDNKDTITIMVYMCGTDLESKYGMATNDLAEMAKAKYGDNINIIVYTGGCSNWKTSGISNKVNQIYQVKDGGLKSLKADDGSAAMTDPKTLTSFIKYCTQNFPANRNELILWDHGGGSVSGYGYDEKNKKSGSMSLSGINKALKDSGTTFDFIGFDACLMATAETALMLDQYADYLIASEETEPGIGWYYTNWLTKLGENTSMPTVDIGKNIIDDFVAKCATDAKGSKTTLSIIDLAEFANTVPENLAGFSKSVSSLINDKEYKTVSDARYKTREFAASSKIDQVDLVNLAENVGTDECKKLAEAVKGAVKYNRTGGAMTNAYGVSIYFPYKRTSYVDTACSTYSQIGLDDEYSKCIKQFASLETSGQIAAGGTGSAAASLFGGLSSGSSGNADAIGQLLSAFMGGGRSIAGLDDTNTGFMSENALSEEETAQYLAKNYLDASKLVWENDGSRYTLELSDDQWKLVHLVDLNMFYDNGECYVDLGLDNVYSYDGNKLVADTERNWVSINGQPVAYYHTDTYENGDEYTITGYVPALLNGERVKLYLVFDNETPNGYIAGAEYDYRDETETIAKSMTELNTGDTLDFICSCYTYDGELIDEYKLGEQMTVTDDMVISNTDVGSGQLRLMYKLTDIYEQEYWTQAIMVR